MFKLLKHHIGSLGGAEQLPIPAILSHATIPEWTRYVMVVFADVALFTSGNLTTHAWLAGAGAPYFINGPYNVPRGPPPPAYRQPPSHGYGQVLVLAFACANLFIRVLIYFSMRSPLLAFLGHTAIRSNSHLRCRFTLP